MKHLPFFLTKSSTFVAVVVLLSACVVGAEESDGLSNLSISQQEGQLVVTIGDQHFATIDYSHYAKPIVYPIHGPDQTPMTRNYPMKKGVAGEATDHPHHKSMWFGHGDVNGISFWHEQGKVEHDKIGKIDNEPTQPSVTLHSRLIGPDGKLIARESATLTFRATPDVRFIDWDVEIRATESDLRFGDTKEGMMAIRTHPNLRLEGDVANGSAVNSEGVSGKAIWGKAAKWVDYFGRIDDKPVGIAIFDHPENFRHPTHWHARAYGLVAANPFGLSYFVGNDQDGTHIVPKGESIRFRYRFAFHRGTNEDANISELYENYSKTDLVAED